MIADVSISLAESKLHAEFLKLSMKSIAKPFKENLNRLLDIAVIEIETIIPSDKKRSRDSQKNDLEFLKDQRGPRKEYLGTEDNMYKEKVSKHVS